jgi:hypothetical protein
MTGIYLDHYNHHTTYNYRYVVTNKRGGLYYLIRAGSERGGRLEISPRLCPVK